MGKGIVWVAAFVLIVLFIGVMPVQAKTSDQIKEEIEALEKESQQLQEQMLSMGTMDYYSYMDSLSQQELTAMGYNKN